MKNISIWSHLFFAVAACLFSDAVWAYPEFIGYGYSSCLTCHYNGQGSGPLNDYGRALWSAEIASRWLYPTSVTDEKIAERSGFLGSVQLPFWLRPHIKYRGMDYVTNPESGSNSTTKYFNMQEDFGATLQDEAGKYVASLTIGHMVRPEDYAAGREGLQPLMAREYFVRLQIGESWWLYGGLLEKVYGLRNIDHSSLQRKYQGFNEQVNDPQGISTAEGVILQKVAPTYEITGNAFFGNPYDNAAARTSGVSVMGEYEVGEKKRLGASFMSAKSQLLEKQLMGVHYRQGLSKASAVLFEAGLIGDTTPTATTANGNYLMAQALLAMTRGYNLKLSAEEYSHSPADSDPSVWRYSFGLLMFPLPRLELRAEFVDVRSLSTLTSTKDQWYFLGQVHVSL